MEYATYESRLASFEPPSKRSKLGWPHKTPTPDELARAGFYYKPSSASNDNTICYLCERQLDGWEPDDDPVGEHLKHSSDCGWAILMSAGQDAKHDISTMEDPTGQIFADARRATFAVGWPHESKRGWRCKIEKMVEAGWHLALLPESEDYVSCAFCKLSLDGWEPKDDPFDEHYRRSPACPFFHFAGTTAPAKRPKAKKGRTSRASRSSKASTRLSTQSNTQDMTTLSEAPSNVNDLIPDLDDSIDTSTMSAMSVMSTASTATTRAKRKAAGGRSKATKSKRTKTTKSTKTKKEEPQPEAEVVNGEEFPAEVEHEQVQVPADIDLEPEVQAEEQQAPPNPAPTPPAQVSYPSLNESNTPPRISSEPRHPSPLGPPPQASPTPLKARPFTSAARTATPKPSTDKIESSRPVSPTPKANHTSSPAPSPSTSDIENAPPSTRPASARPPAPAPPDSSTPSHHRHPNASSPNEGAEMPKWTPADIELIFAPTSPQKVDADIVLGLTGSQLSTDEKNMTVQEWIEFIAKQTEEGLRAETERVVGVFEREGERAMRVLEGIVCV
ncbi:uncharacterized protein Z520_04387 [Fonsecaea multimorphosa CBS 102226]|uniref:BIR-domain-containing protein n=1 Tax=Fonsecaea multimorphosa CBS 102226 TaxID=1442371 RepID=A0A0D2IRX4_9EURO|nr:uncharacterized protein Z520_04387 [Fonsecaea multimorphosa CBS 102226]KIX99751.1 hypothetical protein Z520_04387 [Fonsecaea multimorphosa CBS 102226]OAL26541.1 hypothetical protein AYO22_04152 [Fonsecaea multimorphosa]